MDLDSAEGHHRKSAEQRTSEDAGLPSSAVEGPAALSFEARKRGIHRAIFGDAAPPLHVGRYAILRRLGGGGMGDVFVARDEALGREVAIKLISATGADPARLSRALEREAATLAGVSHPNIVHVYDMGRLGAQIYVVMELVRGETLRSWIAQRRPSVAAILAAYAQAARGLAAIHEAGIVHRDVKPDNIIIDSRGWIRVLDFGVARVAGELVPLDRGTVTRSSDGDAKTDLSSAAGTLEYMAPEQLRSGRCDRRVDEFALCVALYEGITGHRPYEDCDWGSGSSPPDAALPRFPKLSRAVRTAIERGLAVDPRGRSGDLAGLAAILSSHGTRSRWWIAGIALPAALVGAAGLFADSDSCARAAETLEIERFWSKEDRRDFVGAFLGSDAPYTADVLETVEAKIEAFVRDLEEEQREACVATNVRMTRSAAALDAHSACLQQVSDRLEAALSTLVEGAPESARLAVEVIEALPSAKACRESPAVSLDHGLDPSRVRSVRASLATAHALLDAGRPDRARQTVEALVSVVDESLADALAAEISFGWGRVWASLGATLEAREALLEAAEAAHTRGDAELEYRIWAALTRWACSETVELDSAATWLRLARASSSRLGDDPAKQATIAEMQGSLAHLDGDAEVARVWLTEARDILQRAGQVESRRYVAVIANLADVLVDLEAPDDARRLYDEALTLDQRLLGERHPEVALDLYNLGTVVLAQGDLEAANRAFEHALDIWQGQPGGESTEASLAHLALVEVELQGGSLLEASRHATAAIALRDDQGDHPDLAAAEIAAGAVAVLRGEPHVALSFYSRGHDRFSRVLGPRAPSTLITAGNIAEALLLLGRIDEADELVTMTIDALERRLGADAASLAVPLKVRGQVMFARGRAETALEPFEQALSLLGDAETIERAHVRLLLQKALVATNPSDPRVASLGRDAEEDLASLDPIIQRTLRHDPIVQGEATNVR